MVYERAMDLYAKLCVGGSILVSASVTLDVVRELSNEYEQAINFSRELGFPMGCVAVVTGAVGMLTKLLETKSLQEFTAESIDDRLD